MKRTHWLLPVASIVLAPGAFAQVAGTVQTLYTNIATSPTSDVPGLPGTKFTSGSGTTNFDMPMVSPNGLHWGIRADTPLTGTEDSVFIYNNTLLMREGTPAPAPMAANWGPTDIRVGINDAGEVCLYTNTTEAADDDYIVKYDPIGGTWSLIVKESSPVPALPGVTYDFDLDSISLLTDGRVAFRAIGLDGTGMTTTNDGVFVLDTTILQQEGVSIPTGQAGGGTLSWETMDFEDCLVSPDGLNWLADGHMTGATTSDDITVYNGAVVIQEGSTLPGTAFVSPVASLGPDEVALDNAGRWYARGGNVDAIDWVLRNGVVIAETDAATGASNHPRMIGPADGAQVVPASGSLATGTAVYLVNTSTNTLFYEITLTGLGVGTETAANISGFAAAGFNGAPLYSLPLGNSKTGSLTYLESEEANFIAGLAYLEILTTTFPAGEIRGQITPSVESWDDTDFGDCFFAMQGNVRGDYVVGGVTNGPSNANGVVVLNGNTVVLREGDPLDIDGNGLFDDNAFINTMGNDDLVITEDGSIYFTATVKDAANSAYAQGVFRRQGSGFTMFCAGDGSFEDHTTACPCGNEATTPGHGCGHSFDPGGARLTATGLAAADNVILTTNFTPATAFTLMMQHSAAADGTFHDGVLCAGGTLIRLRGRGAVGGSITFPDSNFPNDVTLTLSQRGQVVVGSGVRRYYGGWYRNASTTFCPPATANVTNGFLIDW